MIHGIWGFQDSTCWDVTSRSLTNVYGRFERLENFKKLHGLAFQKIVLFMCVETLSTLDGMFQKSEVIR
jgi:hypothetical protein